ncbi:MAG TPA: hypothetical protein VIQ60_06005 [Gemmatimonadaceae bacterium]
MAASDAPEPGTIGWADLTVADAEHIRDFYAAVTGWVPQPLSMGDYADYVMTAPGTAAPGGCLMSGKKLRQGVQR